MIWQYSKAEVFHCGEMTKSSLNPATYEKDCFCRVCGLHFVVKPEIAMEQRLLGFYCPPRQKGEIERVILPAIYI